MTLTRSLIVPRQRTVRGPFARLLRRPLAVVSALVLIVIIAACLLAPVLPLAAPNQNDLLNALAAPSPAHPLGTDQLGRDLLSRLLWGGIPSLGYAGVVLVVALGLGVPLGILAGYLGGSWDRTVTTIADIGLAMPVLIMTIVILSVFDDMFWVAMVLLGVLMCPPVIRNVRGAVIAVRRENFVDAARVAGLSPARVMSSHILPRIIGPVLVQATLLAGVGIAFTVGLAFLGFGPQPPDPTWGGMIQDAVLVLTRSQWPMIVAGSAVAITVLALNILGDSLREATVDPWAGSTRRPQPTPRSVSPARATQHAKAAGTPSHVLEPSAALVAVRDLDVRYSANGRDVLVVEGVSLDIGPGESVGLVGESGCGKSTVARAIARILPGAGRTSGGSVQFRSQDVLNLEGKALQAYRGGSVGYVFQDPMATLEPSMRVGALLALVIRLHYDVSRRESRERALELLRRVQIKDAETIARRYPHELSGGLAQRVAIARAIACEPSLLIADEPTTALDASIRLGVLELLRSLQRESGMAMLIVSHDWDVIGHLCDRAVVMYSGQVAEEGRVEDLLEHTAHPYTRALLACRPRTDADRAIPLVSTPGQVAAPGSWPTGCRFADRCPIARDDCRHEPIALAAVTGHQSSRCLFIDEVLAEPSEVVR